MGDFAKLGLKKEILGVLSKLNLTEPFEVQEKVVPLAIKGKNIVFTAQTGSGKTLAYTLGYLGKLNRKQGVQMIVLVPTRELCIQVGKEITKLCGPLGFKVGMLYGGREIKGDYRTLNTNNQVIIGTPGRLIAHINEKRIKIGDTKYLVYDEADQMLDQGFYSDCAYMKRRVSNTCQIIFASATKTEKVKEFVENNIIEYESLQIGEMIPIKIIQEKLYCEKIEKNQILLDLFSDKRFKQAIIFCNTKEKSYNIAEFFQNNKFNSRAINSDLTQDERLQNLNEFKNGTVRILVGTDVAARGLHINKVDLVINYDVPTKEEFYVHRIGRTGRAGKKGRSLTLICPEDIERFHSIEITYDLDVEDITKEDS